MLELRRVPASSHSSPADARKVARKVRLHGTLHHASDVPGDRRHNIRPPDGKECRSRFSRGGNNPAYTN